MQRARNAIPCASRDPLPQTFRFAIRFSYDGTDYFGFQSQSDPQNIPTVQDELERRLQNMLKRKIRVLGWGRTDAGVHANGAVCTIDLSLEEVKKFSKSSALLLNHPCSGSNHDITSEALIQTASILQSALKEFACGRDHKPGSIAAQKCTPVPPTFDARFSCIWKRYVYTISCSKSRSPFLSRYAWEMDIMLNYDLMVQASSILAGKHDFTWLSVIQPGDEMNPVRNLTLMLEKKPRTMITTSGSNVDKMDPSTLSFPSNEHLIQISATSDFFLYKMVRRIVGILVAIGSGKVDLNDLATCMAFHDDHSIYMNHPVLVDCKQRMDSKTSCQNGLTTSSKSIVVPKGLIQTAPAHGLTLDHVEYNILV